MTGSIEDAQVQVNVLASSGGIQFKSLKVSGPRVHLHRFHHTNRCLEAFQDGGYSARSELTSAPSRLGGARGRGDVDVRYSPLQPVGHGWMMRCQQSRDHSLVMAITSVTADQLFHGLGFT